MTHNQIDYAKLQETHRANLVQERLGQGKLEVERQNALTNARNAATNERNAATNEAGLLISEKSVSVAAQQAANQAAANAESQRHNLAMEAETHRNNDLLYTTKEHSTMITARGQDIASRVQERGQNVQAGGKLIDLGGSILKGLVSVAAR